MVDILEKHAHELVRDALGIAQVHRERRAQVLAIFGESRGIVFHALGIQFVGLAESLKIVGNIVKMYFGHLKHVSSPLLACYRCRIHEPRVIAYRTWLLCLNEVAEVLVGLHVSPRSTLCLEINVKRAIVHLKHHGIQASPVFHPWVILWPPRHEVFAIRGRKAWSIVVHREQQSPRAVSGMEHIRLEHAFFLTPWTIVGRTQLPQVFPTVFVGEISHVQPCPVTRTVKEYLASGVLAHHFIGGPGLGKCLQ